MKWLIAAAAALVLITGVAIAQHDPDLAVTPAVSVTPAAFKPVVTPDSTKVPRSAPPVLTNPEFFDPTRIRPESAADRAKTTNTAAKRDGND